ncbi:MAG: histidine kinase dimerization/phosphoacceptor domain -containing protein [Pseudomonadota bacterium]
MTTPAAPTRSFSQRLGVRLAFAFAISLLPLGVISGMQSRSLMDEARARSTAALLGETLLAAGPEARLIRGARVAAEALAITIPGLSDDSAQCSAALRRLQQGSADAYSYIAYIPASGDARCTSTGEAMDFSASSRLAAMAADPRPDTTVIRNGAASNASVLAFGHPVLDDAGRFLGYVTISMPHSVLENREPSQTGLTPNQLQPIALITFDAKGNILTSSTGMDDAPMRVPNDRELTDLANNVARTFTATSRIGNERIYAVFPLIDDTIFAIGSWPVVVAGSTFNLWVSPYFMPALMWMASLFVAMLASERLVTRHIRTLRRSITSFAAGNHRMDDLPMDDAAIEIRDVAESYLKMTDTILHDEAELENMVHQREVLLREVHHRVKNNLQLISSIMNMQMRQSHSKEAKVLMKGLQDRVMSLATIHRGLYQTSGLADVRADELLTDIVRQIIKMATGPGHAFDVSTHFDDLRLTPDQAVPMSLLLTEALTNAIKYAGTDAPGLPQISVSLRRDGETDAVLRIANSVMANPAPRVVDPGTGLGTQLLTAFGQQLGATSTTGTENGIYALEVRFTVRSLVEAEARANLAARSAEDDADADPAG